MIKENCRQTADLRPVPFVDTASLSREEWLEYRKHGIGASDLPVLMEASEYKSVLGLFEEKISRKPREEIDEMVRLRMSTEEIPVVTRSFWYDEKFGEPVIDPGADFNLTTEVGRALEPVTAKYLSCRLGLPMYRDTMMYRHPVYPFLLANLDFVMLAPDPETDELNRLIIIECKTASFWKKDDWAEGVPYSYELQCRQAMCVMNVEEVLIICLFDNNEGGVEVYRITRDYSIEADIIQRAKAFWLGNVEKKILPVPTVPTKAAKRELASYAKKQEKWRPLPQLFERGLAELVRQYEDLYAVTQEQKDIYETSKEALDTVEMKLSSFMFHHDEAVCGDLKLRWKEKTSRSMDYDAFKLAYPLLYAQFVSENVNFGFEAKLKKSVANKLKKEAA